MIVLRVAHGISAVRNAVVREQILEIDPSAAASGFTAIPLWKTRFEAAAGG
jgi:hypothetical protein